MERRQQATKYTTEGNKLVGYAAVWDSETEVREAGRTFTELVKRGAFSKSIGTDILICFNHDVNKLLGRTASGTATVSEDDHGLRFEVDLPDTETGREVRELAARNDLNGASFTFVVPKGGDRWQGNRRELREVSLYECGPVVCPQYKDTSVAVRSKITNYKYRLELLARI